MPMREKNGFNICYNSVSVTKFVNYLSKAFPCMRFQRIQTELMVVHYIVHRHLQGQLWLQEKVKDKGHAVLVSQHSDEIKLLILHFSYFHYLVSQQKA